MLLSITVVKYLLKHCVMHFGSEVHSDMLFFEIEI